MGTTNPAAPGALSVTRLPGHDRVLATWVIADHDQDDQDIVTVVNVLDGPMGRLVEVGHCERADAGFSADSGAMTEQPVLYRAAEVLVLAKVLLEADALASGIGAEVAPLADRRRHRGEMAA